MSGVGVLIAIILQFMCAIGAAAEFGAKAGIYVVAAIIANAVQIAFKDNGKEK